MQSNPVKRARGAEFRRAPSSTIEGRSWIVRPLPSDPDVAKDHLRRLHELQERADYHERAVMRSDLEFLRPDAVRFVEEVSP